MSEEILNISKIKKLQKCSLPYTMKDHAKNRKWQLKESAQLKKETLCLEKVLQNEMKYDKYNIYLCTYHPKKASNKLSKCFSNINQNLSDFDSFQNQIHSRVKTLVNIGSLKSDETVLVQDLEKWQKDKKIPYELYDSNAIMKRNRLYQKVKEEIKKDEFFKANKLLPITKKESSFHLKVDEFDQRNQLISMKSTPTVEINKTSTNQKTNIVLEKGKDFFEANKLTKEEQETKNREDIGIELNKKFVKLNEFLQKKRKRLNSLEEKLEEFKRKLQNSIEEEKKIIEELKNSDNIQQSTKKMKRGDSRGSRQSSKKETLFDIEKKNAKLNQIKELIPYLNEKIVNLRLIRIRKYDKMNELKEEVNKLKSELIEYFYSILLYPNEFMTSGISFIFEKIWNVGEDINILRMPKYLDSLSIKYLIESRKKEIQLRDLKKEYDKIKSDLKINISPRHSEKILSHESRIPQLNKLKQNIREEIQKSKLKNGTGNTQNIEDSGVVSPRSINILRKHRNQVLDLKCEIDNLKNDIQKDRNSELNRIVREYLKQVYLAKEISELDTIIKTIFGESVTQIEIEKIIKSQSEAKRRFNTVHICRKIFGNLE